MKRNKLVLTILIVGISTLTISAGESPVITRQINFNQVEANLLAGIGSDNRGLFISSTQKLGDIKSEKAVIPLMKVLKSGNDESSRLAAALALYKIGSSKGLYAVKMASKYDDSQRVRNLCDKFYKESLRS
jgi:HEAT repeat protein